MKNKIEQLYNAFESKKRDNGETFVCLKDDVSEELKDSFRNIHGVGMFPDDYRYGAVADLCCTILEYDFETADDLRDFEHEIIDSHVDIYTYELTKWLGSNNQRPSYCDDAVSNGLCDGSDVLSTIQCGQYEELLELFNNIIFEFE